MADGTGAVVRKGTGGRPKKARGAATSSDASDARWSVRGVPLNVRSMAIKAAENSGMTVGDWLSEAVIAFSRGDRGGVKADSNSVSADGGTNLPAMPIPQELTAMLETITDRLARLEAQQQKTLFGGLFRRTA